MRTISLSSRRTAMVAAATLSLAAATLTGIAMAPAANAVVVPAITLSATSGPSTGANSLTATTTTNAFYSGVIVELQYKQTAATVCSPAYTTPGAPTVGSTLATGTGNVAITGAHVLSTKKIAFTVPTFTTPTLLTAALSATSATYLVCTYPSATLTTALLTASSSYTVAGAPGVTSITPSSGPALGGGTVIVLGTNFTATTTAMIGSVPMPVTLVDSTHLSGVVPPQSAAVGLSVSVSNTGGTATTASLYTYSNGITVSPNTVTAAGSTDVDIQGVGFSALHFVVTTGAAIDSSDAHVYLTNGNYTPAVTTKTHPEIGECLNVLVISDTELICTVTPLVPDGLGATLAAVLDGTYTITTVSAGDAAVHTVGTAGYTQSILSSGATFTVAAY